MQNKISFWQLLFYVSWSVLGIWIILKLTGIINTPFWLEFGVPIVSVFVGIFGLYHNILDQLKTVTVGMATLNIKFEHLDKDVEVLKDGVRLLKDDMGMLKNDVGMLKNDMGSVKKHLSI